MTLKTQIELLSADFDRTLRQKLNGKPTGQTREDIVPTLAELADIHKWPGAQRSSKEERAELSDNCKET